MSKLLFETVYCVISTLLLPVYLLVMIVRIFMGKDELRSIVERLCLASHKRPKGKLIWLHAASVGESMVALTMIKAMQKKYPRANFLITTGTLASAKIIHQAAPKKCAHQFTPIDTFPTVELFLIRWQPDISIFIESEIWPCLLMRASRRSKMLLVNARLSNRSYRRWTYATSIFKILAAYFDHILTQSGLDAKKFTNLGARNVKELGNLKFSNKELDVNKDMVKEMKKFTGKKKILVAASTHAEDEEIVFITIRKLLNSNVDFFPVIIVRHPERRNEITTLCKYYKLQYSLRSSCELPKEGDDIFIVDSFGELGTFYELADVTFVGGSFKRGGHNLVEPAYFNCAIIVGPDMSHYQEITEEMLKQKAALQIDDCSELEQQLKKLLDSKNDKERKALAKNATKYVENREKVIEKYMDYVDTT